MLNAFVLMVKGIVFLFYFCYRSNSSDRGSNHQSSNWTAAHLFSIWKHFGFVLLVKVVILNRKENTTTVCWNVKPNMPLAPWRCDANWEDGNLKKYNFKKKVLISQMMSDIQGSTSPLRLKKCNTELTICTSLSRAQFDIFWLSRV